MAKRTKTGGGGIILKDFDGPLVPKMVAVNAALSRWIKRNRDIMANHARKETKIIHGQEVEVTILPLADVTGEFPRRPTVGLHSCALRISDEDY